MIDKEKHREEREQDVCKARKSLRRTTGNEQKEEEVREYLVLQLVIHPPLLYKMYSQHPPLYLLFLQCWYSNTAETAFPTIRDTDEKAA